MCYWKSGKKNKYWTCLTCAELAAWITDLWKGLRLSFAILFLADSIGSQMGAPRSWNFWWELTEVPVSSIWEDNTLFQFSFHCSFEEMGHGSWPNTTEGLDFLHLVVTLLWTNHTTSWIMFFCVTRKNLLKWKIKSWESAPFKTDLQIRNKT